MRKILICSFILLCHVAMSQSAKLYSKIDEAIFADNTHHWYDIGEKDKLIHPLPGRPRYKPSDLAPVAENILLFQKTNGGWPKNYDMLAILSPAQKDSLLASKAAINTTFDNRSTYTQIATLAGVYQALADERYKAAALKGLDFILSAQFANGGWPQYYPLEKNNYSSHITFNDDAMGGVMWLIKDIIEEKPVYAFIDPERRFKLKTAFEKGLDCILKTQINDTGKPTAWCQQYDEKTLQPAWARKFEPASICNGESVDIVLLLMSIKNPSAEIIAAVDNAVAWFNESKILNTRVNTIDAPEMVTPYLISKTDRVVVIDSTAPPIWTRYYELKTHRPLFCNRDSKVVYSLAEVERERRDGYGWYTYGPQKVLDKYEAWKKSIVPANEGLDWKAPYSLPEPKGWDVERFVLPANFAPSIPYKGMEDIRFTPGWAKKGSKEYWTYAFLWYLDGTVVPNSLSISKNLDAYYSGLFKVNTDSSKRTAMKPVPVKTSTKKITTATGDLATYQATVSMPDYMTYQPIILNLLIHLRNCPGQNKTFIFHEVSPLPYNDPVWKNLDWLWEKFECARSKAE